MARETMNGRMNDMTIAEFETMLEAWGAAPERWPASRRLRAEALLLQSAAARIVLAEARALDQLLDLAASDTPPLRPGLADAIVARARVDALTPAKATDILPDARPSAQIITMADRRGRTSIASPKAAGGLPRLLRPAALVAASLAAGILFGTTEYGASSANQLLSVATGPSEVEQVLRAIDDDGIVDSLVEEPT